MNIPQYMPTVTEDDIASVSAYLKSGGFITEYKYSRDFEKKLAEISQTKYAVLFPNGTLTMFSIMKCLDLQKTDKVLVPNYTMAATAFAPIEAGFEVKFADVEFPTLTLNLEIIKKECEKDRNIKVIFLVSANGREPNDGIESIAEFCNTNNLYLIEDAAQGLGSTYRNGKPVGSASLASSISFSMPKIITTGQGGVVLTNSSRLFKKLQNYRDFGRLKSGNDIHNSIGLNLKFTDLQAVLGISQLNNIQKRVDKKKRIFQLYKQGINSEFIKIIDNPQNVAPWFIEIISDHRDQLIQYLCKNGIGNRIMYPPLNSQESFKYHPQYKYKFKNSEIIGRKGLWLPSFFHITHEQINFIIDKLNNFKI